MTKTDYFDEMIYYFTFIRKYIYEIDNGFGDDFSKSIKKRNIKI